MSDPIDDLDDLYHIESGIQRRLAIVRSAREALKREKIARGEEKRAVTDHALVRYLERCKGVDMEAMREELRRMADEATPAKDGEHHWHATGAVLVLGEGGQVVTVLSNEQAQKWLGRRLGNGARAVTVGSSAPKESYADDQKPQ